MRRCTRAEKLKNLITTRAWKDEQFEKELKLDPKQALSFLGKESLQFINLKENTLIFTLPASPVQYKSLSDSEIYSLANKPPWTIDCTAYCK